ncbi:MAG: thiamine pyrophosphate-binding protein, partial [Gemmatimonadaceae bacterium]
MTQPIDDPSATTAAVVHERKLGQSYNIDEPIAGPSSRVLNNATVSQVLLEYLKLEGATTMFGIPGAAVMHLLNELKNQRDSFRYIITCHETAAAYMADGHARLSGKLGVVITTSGPGAINALTGSMNAQASGIPLLTITGEVPEQFFGMGYLQEGTDSSLNVNAVYASATGYSVIATSEANFNTLMPQALRDALGLPHRAVHISLPDDIAAATIKTLKFPTAPHNYRTSSHASDKRDTARALRHLLNVARPLILVGSGARASLGAAGREKLEAIATRFAIPVMTTSDAKNAFPESHAMSLRNFGTSFCEWTKYYMCPWTLDKSLQLNYDALLVLGSQLDGMNTNKFDPILLPKESLVQVDIDATVIGRVFPVDFGIIADIDCVLHDMHELAMKLEPDTNVEPRRAFIERIKRESPFLEPDKYHSLQTPILPQAVMKCMNELLPDNSVLFVDNGNSFGWVLHYLSLNETSRVFTSLAMGPMGWGICAAIGAKLAAPENPCFVVAGDGAFMMHGAEVSTAAANKVGAIFIVLNDNDLGMVSQGMNHFFPDKTGEWTDYYSIGKPDLALFGQSLGADAYNVSTVEDMQRALPAAIRAAELNNKPQVIVVHIDGKEIPPFYQDPGPTPALNLNPPTNK